MQRKVRQRRFAPGHVRRGQQRAVPVRPAVPPADALHRPRRQHQHGWLRRGGNRTATSDARGFIWTTKYDADNRTWQQMAPGNQYPTVTLYDQASEVVSVTDPNRNTTTDKYDADGELTSQTVPLTGTATATTTWNYNA